MAVSHRTVISFGLVAIPIALYTATQDYDIHFNQLHKEDHSRIRYKKTCVHCGKEIGSEDIVRGYEYDKDHYVVVTEEELEKIKTEKDRSIQILHFAQLNQISPVYYEKTYQAVPEAGGEKAFELLRAALMAEQKIAIGKAVLGTRDTLMAIIPREGGVLISTMFYADEVKDLPKSYQKPEVSEAEVNMIIVFSVGAADQSRAGTGHRFDFFVAGGEIGGNLVRGQGVEVRVRVGMTHHFFSGVGKRFDGLGVFCDPISNHEESSFDLIPIENVDKSLGILVSPCRIKGDGAGFLIFIHTIDG